MRSVKSLVLILVLTGCAFLGGRPVPRAPMPTHITLTPEIVQAMFDIQRFFPVETARCLHGGVHGDTLYIEEMTPAWINASDSVSVNFVMCPEADVVGWFHNHTLLASLEAIGADTCAPSVVDLTTLVRSGMLIGILTCSRPSTLVWSFAYAPYRLYSWTGAPPDPRR